MKTVTAKNNRAVYNVGSILLYRLHLIYKVKNRFEYYITSLIKSFVLNFLDFGNAFQIFKTVAKIFKTGVKKLFNYSLILHR